MPFFLFRSFFLFPPLLSIDLAGCGWWNEIMFYMSWDLKDVKDVLFGWVGFGRLGR